MLVIAAKLNEPHPIEQPRLATDDTNLNGYLNSLVKNHGGVPEDYYIRTLNESNTIAQRILAGDEYVLVWADNKITGADFSSFDIKGLVRFSSNKSEILADNVEKCRIQVKLYNSDSSDLDLTISGVTFPVMGPLGECSKKVDLISGVVIFDFKTNFPGPWYFPTQGELKIKDYKVRNPIVINALVP